MKAKPEYQGNENDAIEQQFDAPSETSRADEARVSLDMAIDAYLEIYNAVVAKVPGEHAQAAIFAALVSGK